MTGKQLESYSWSLSVNQSMARLSPPEISSSFLSKHTDPRFCREKGDWIGAKACSTMRVIEVWWDNPELDISFSSFSALRDNPWNVRLQGSVKCRYRQIGLHHNRFSHFPWSDTAVEAQITSPCAIHEAFVIRGTVLQFCLLHPLVGDCLIIFNHEVKVGLRVGERSHPFEFRCTRFPRRLSHSITFHSQDGLSLRPTCPYVQNSKFTGKVCSYTGFGTISFTISCP